MNAKLRNGLLLFLFLFTLCLRLSFAFEAEHLSPEAYFAQRQVEHIKETGFPLYEDELSFSGRDNRFMPLFYYLLAIFSYLIPFSFIAKVLPNVFASLIVLFSYQLAHAITKDEQAGLFTAFIAAFIPVFFKETLLSVSPLSLVIPLLLYQTYCFIHYKKRLPMFIFLSFLLPLLHSSALLLSVGFVLFLFLGTLEKYHVKRAYIEMTLFSLLVYVWLLFLFFREAILTHGFSAILNPIAVHPASLVSFELIKAVYLIGIIPFIYGLFSSYQFLFQKRHLPGVLLLSLSFTSLLFLWIGFIDVRAGLLMLGVFLTVLFGYHYHALRVFVKKTRFSHFKYYQYYFVVSLVVTFVITSFLPSLHFGNVAVAEAVNEDELAALSWIRTETAEDAVILASLQEGHLITALGERKNILDDQSLLITDYRQRYQDYQRIFTSPYKVETIDLLSRYDIAYVYVSYRLDQHFRLPKFLDDCFSLRFHNPSVTIWEVTCSR